MNKVIIFSKNRLMQLHCLLKSIRKHTSFAKNSHEIILITPSADLYREHLSDSVMRHIDNIYDDSKSSLQDILTKQLVKSEYELCYFFVDDFIFWNDFTTKTEATFKNKLELVQGLYGMSLRLGLNSNHQPEFNYIDDDISIWFKQFETSHWRYPFSISADVYPKRVVSDIIQNVSSEIPNDLESLGCRYVEDVRSEWQRLACVSNNSLGGCADINRCQDKYPNKTNGESWQTPEKLNDMYISGYRMVLNDNVYEENDPFIGHKYLEFKKLG